MTFYLEDTNKILAHNAEVMANGDSMFVVQGVTIGSATDWDGVAAASGASIQVQGTIMSVGGNALSFSGGGNHVNVSASGAIMGNLSAGAAITTVFGHLSLVNAGEISGFYGINCGSSDNIIHNSGHISATSDAIHIAWSSNNDISNSGLIESTEGDAISIGTGGDSFWHIENSGTIRATLGHDAINTTSGWGDVINTGHIVGNIDFTDGGCNYYGGEGTIDGTILGGAGNDRIVTGAGRDSIVGAAGADQLEGGAGRDHFYFNAVGESTGDGHDLLTDFDFKRDVLSGNMAGVAGVDATIASGKLRGDHFNGDLAKAVDATHLLANHAVLFTPNAGSEKGDVFLIVDANGVAGYQANADYVVQMHNPDNMNLFSLKTFGF